MKKVVVGLSGGVDSSVAAALLCRSGHDVIGLTLWLMRGKGQCCSEGMVDAAKICEQLGITHQIIDSRDTFEQYIIDYLVTGYEAGITPLPCSQCNKAVKFGPMVKYAQTELGYDYIATGHYARITQDEATGRYQLRRAVDRSKDQSYFLYDLEQHILAATLFPLGDTLKTQTRDIAASLDLSTADKPESQDLCLVEKHGSMQSFLDRYINQHPGDIVDTSGQVVGQHTGIHHYTIGQRKGIGIAAPEPLYVVALDAIKNRVVVGSRTETHSLECSIDRVNWVSIVPLDGDRVKLVFDEPQFGITPGQAAVWYDGDIVLGGGIIERF
jgi:tRNA-uridine 2-sulfurtransferase